MLCLWDQMFHESWTLSGLIICIYPLKTTGAYGVAAKQINTFNMLLRFTTTNTITATTNTTTTTTIICIHNTGMSSDHI